MEQNYPSPTGMPPVGGPPPKNWLVESILVTIFCCLPFGIAGIVNAANVNSRYSLGDYAGAVRASEQAAKWTKIGFFIWLAGTVIWIVMMMLGFGGAMLSGFGDGFNNR
ncbi:MULTISPECIES: CD225/dispanin family protein [Hymenobacter]|uniref:CD225/dispanin family protein n=1 Tax=Hymenobacter jejuensis TaxID=2502781 RepID=A0A5B7ZZK2_9BACT|nr:MULTISPECIES: CD225/dispanin family protein [Hymenobacter]MBC6992417.1 CD225/dispanin family protein [Hymenobacter sp. BT491]QDA60299.1 CD225/dispanin family protein [Hymenobacter jejuensis]